eukprot:Partr_v1_DN24193_c0_g1_i2_m71124 putative deoxyhypusine synthase
MRIIATLSANSSIKMVQEIPESLKTAVLAKSADIPSGMSIVKGPDFSKGANTSDMIRNHYVNIGYQATALGKAISLVNSMRSWRLSDEPMDGDECEPYNDPEVRANTKCTIFLGYTSNLVSSGLREIIRYLAQESMVDVIVATAGGVEEDFIKCLAPTYVLGTFNADGCELRKNGMNRIGNLIVPNDNYCKFEDWLMPILDQMLLEQKRDGTLWTPSHVIHRLGKEINHPESIYYWCYKNNIPVFCPALTDGSLGDMIFFHSYQNPGLVIDIVEDIRGVNKLAMEAKKTGSIILGGGIVKHHICNANLMRNGTDFALFINTGQEYDGSDSGASPEEAVSWGKLKADSERVKIFADATLVFPLIVAETFAKSDK